MIVGEGPELAKLKSRYPNAHFLGHRPNDELAEIYASADVFVFPSRTDTFGNVIIEALASGTPVAAYPVTGPIDIVGDGFGGAVSNDLREAALAALGVDRAQARERAMIAPSCSQRSKCPNSICSLISDNSRITSSARVSGTLISKAQARCSASKSSIQEKET